MPSSRFTSLRNAFLTGLVLVAPLVATVWVLRLIISFVGGSITPLFLPYLPEMLSHLPSLVWDVLATLIALGFVTLLGYVSHLFLGQFVGALGERLIQGIPGIGGFYNSVKQFIETFGAKDRTQFSKVVLVQFPRPGAYTIGFVTNTGQGELHTHFKNDHWAVFVPTCPSPVNGFFMYLPAMELIELDMSVGDGMKTVISCGAVLPTWNDPAAAKAALKKN
ncbi:DUF502 domain-containing protein [Opitutus sp. GAS368]|jgi:uncharacterized membrane protein|uniref:DUF502 domain-containing protein n=1 Tax=Opitutus sp. GAS368 TaxID=1882749 RepID=UPI00087B9850|nr:DUF502 domain-containing protein [Opitutus sp. GAS368]SDR67741.1 Uncharacterized membrane protein [Opitutus sp. GAS368]